MLGASSSAGRRQRQKRARHHCRHAPCLDSTPWGGGGGVEWGEPQGGLGLITTRSNSCVE